MIDICISYLDEHKETEQRDGQEGQARQEEMSRAEYRRKWRAENPEKMAAQRKRQAEKLRADPEKFAEMRAKKTARNMWRYYNDPAYRERQRELHKRWEQRRRGQKHESND